MAIEPIESLSALVGFSVEDTQQRHLNLIDFPIGGGKQTRESLKRLAEHPAATTLTISGLDQSTFEYLVETFGGQFWGLHFWKCPKIVDFSPLETLPQLTHVAIYWNQRAASLWNFQKSPALKGIQFEDFTKLRRLDDLIGAKSLRELVFGDKVWSKFVIETLDPISQLVDLESISFNAKQIVDGRIQPLAKLSRLKALRFAPNQFSFEQIAWLRARLGDSLTSQSLEPILRFDSAIERNGKMLDVLVNGKRGPFLDSRLDTNKIKRYETEFAALVERFAVNASLEPAPAIQKTRGRQT
jgi:hypothetical protein